MDGNPADDSPAAVFRDWEDLGDYLDLDSDDRQSVFVEVVSPPSWDAESDLVDSVHPQGVLHCLQMFPLRDERYSQVVAKVKN